MEPIQSLPSSCVEAINTWRALPPSPHRSPFLERSFKCLVAECSYLVLLPITLVEILTTIFFISCFKRPNDRENRSRSIVQLESSSFTLAWIIKEIQYTFIGLSFAENEYEARSHFATTHPNIRNHLYNQSWQERHREYNRRRGILHPPVRFMIGLYHSLNEASQNLWKECDPNMYHPLMGRVLCAVLFQQGLHPSIKQTFTQSTLHKIALLQKILNNPYGVIDTSAWKNPTEHASFLDLSLSLGHMTLHERQQIQTHITSMFCQLDQLCETKEENSLIAQQSEATQQLYFLIKNLAGGELRNSLLKLNITNLIH